MQARIVLLGIILATGSWAAEVAPTGIEGRVKDGTGLAVPAARILLKGLVERETLTDTEGQYRITGVPVGRYRLIAEKSGFTVVQREVELGPETGRVELALEPAPVLQVMEVEGAPEVVGEAVLKLATSLQELPRAASVYSANELRERNVRNVPELLAFVPGMNPNSNRAGGYHFYARGFRMLPGDTRVDGFQGINQGGGYGASTFGIEQAVVLRGPAGLQYGANGSPGGFINLVTKKPQPLRSTRVDLRGGAYAGQGLGLTDRPQGTLDFDSTGMVTKGGRILYRTLYTIENNRYFTQGVLDRGRYYNGSMTFKLDRLGLYSVTPIFQYTSNFKPAGGGAVMSPTTSLATNDGISGPIVTSDLSPHTVNLSTGFMNNLTRQAGFDFRGTPTARWNFNLSYRALRYDRHINQFTPQVSSAAQIALLRDSYTVQRVQSKSEADNRYQNVDFNTSYEFQGRGWRSTFQVGGYTILTNTRTSTAGGTVPAAAYPINIYTGVGAAPQDRFPALLLGRYTTTTNWNGYAQNRTSVLDNRLVLTLGLGYGQSHPGGVPVRKGDPMPNAAALYRVTKDVAVYGSYSTSYNPVDATLQDAQGRLGQFSPTLGKNYEFGAKFEPAGRKASATLSFFKNSIDNGLVQTGVNDLNANGVRYYVEAGTRRGKGAELSTEIKPWREVMVMAAASYTDAIYTGTGPASAASTLAIPGSRAEKTPRWSWNTRAQWERSEGRLSGFGASFALLYQGDRLGSNGARTFTAPDPLIMPAYTRLDASLFYHINEHMDVALNAENLTDRRIFLGATTGSAIEISTPRSATLRWSYRF